MITNFEEVTYELTDYEKTVLLPLLVDGLKMYQGKENAITNKEIVSKMQKHGLKVSDTRVRKLINHIRCNQLVRGVLATSKGYYISKDPQEVIVYVESLDERIREIQRVRDEMFNYYKTIS